MLFFGHQPPDSHFTESTFGELRKGPPFHRSRSYREMHFENASCQMGGRGI